MELIYFLVFVLCLFPSTVPAQQTQSYDYTFMVLQNPMVFTSASPWIIKSIWAVKVVGESPPQYHYYEVVRDCPSAPLFDEQLSNDVTITLSKAWPSPYPNVKTAMEIWRNEYESDDSCTVDILPTSTDYLMKSLYLWEKLEFHNLMGVNGKYKPNTKYETQDVLNDIENLYHVQVILICDGYELVQVRMSDYTFMVLQNPMVFTSASPWIIKSIWAVKVVGESPPQYHHYEVVRDCPSAPLFDEQSSVILPRGRVPTSIIQSKKDMVVPESVAFCMKRMLGAPAEVTILDTQGHFPQLTVYPLLLKVLKGVLHNYISK